MDYIHFQDEGEDEVESDASEDSVEIRNELEARLYGIIHHNDLSQSLPPELSKQFAVDCFENGELIVSLSEEIEEEEKNIVYDKIDLIKRCKQSLDVEQEEEEEDEKEREEYKENLENIIPDTVATKTYLDKSETNHKENECSVQGYENNIDSHCMLGRSDWIDNSKLEYISIKNNKKIKLSNKISNELNHNDCISQNNESNYANKESLNDLNDRIMDLENHLYLHEKRWYEYANNPNCQQQKYHREARRIKKISKQLNRLRNKRINGMRNCNLIVTTNVQEKFKRVIAEKNSINDISDDDEIVVINSAGVTNELDNNNLPLNAGDNCANIIENKCNESIVVVDSDNEVVVLNSVSSDAKQNVVNCNNDNNIDSKINNNSDMIFNYENVTKKTGTEPIVINLESSEEDELTKVSNKNSKKERKHKKKISFSDTPKKWTRKMIKFYCKSSEGRKRFDSIRLIKEMRKTSSWSDWVINKADLCDKRIRTKRRCRYCRETGHHERNCTTPNRAVVCYMCGEPNHRQSSCPQKMCLFCGKRTLFYVQKCTDCTLKLAKKPRCEICNGLHWKEICPDLWRCYHLTTQDGPVVIPDKQNENPRKYCCVCAKEGHFSHECDDPYYFSEELQTSCFVTNYNAIELFKKKYEMILSKHAFQQMNCINGETFLQQLSNDTNVQIDLIVGGKGIVPVIRIFGTSAEWETIRKEVSKFVGETVKNKSHKRPRPRNKRKHKRICSGQKLSFNCF